MLIVKEAPARSSQQFIDQDACFGFDPVEGLSLRTPKDFEKIAQNVRRRAKVPVLVLAE